MQNPPPDYNTPQTPQQGAGGGKSSTGLDGNVAALLAYVLTWVTGLVFFLIEKENRFVRFHAMQAILLGVAFFVIGIVFTFLQGMLAFASGTLAALFGLLWLLVILGFFIIWILCLVKAYQGQTFKLPVIGDMASNIVNK